MRERFILTEGKDFSDHELVEFLLYYSIPRSDTNDTAHIMLKEFGSLSKLFNSDRQRIDAIPGVGSSTSLLFAILFEIRKRIDMEEHTKTRLCANTLSKVGGFLLDYFKGRQTEQFCVLYLDNSMRLMDFHIAATGSVNSVSVNIREITRRGLLLNASNAIIAHNHPGGLLSPSLHDTDITNKADISFSAIDIKLIEHIIVNDESYVTTMHSRMVDPYRTDDIEFFKYFYEN